jgi:hypothetical protein
MSTSPHCEVPPHRGSPLGAQPRLAVPLTAFSARCGPAARAWRCCLCGAPPRRRRIADETPQHGPSPVSTTRHTAPAEPWTVQHLCTQRATTSHDFVVFPKPGVGCSIQPGDTTIPLLRAIFILLSSCRLFRNRQNCRHSADEMGQHEAAWRRTPRHGIRVTRALASVSSHACSSSWSCV